MEAVPLPRLTVTMIMVSVRLESLSSGVSLPNSRMLVVSSGTSKVATAVGTAVGGVGIPSKNGGAAVAVNAGSVRGTLVGVCVGATVMVGNGVLVGVGPGVFVPAGVAVGSGVAVSGTVAVSVGDMSSVAVGSPADLFSPAAWARVGNGSGLVPQLARMMMLNMRRPRERGERCLAF